MQYFFNWFTLSTDIFKFNLDNKDILFINKSIYFHYSLDILEAQVREHFKKIKQEKPEMDDFEEEEKT